MSKLQAALAKLREQGAVESMRPAGKPSSRHLPKSAIPIVDKKNIQFRGPRHHLDEKKLIRRGMLAPLDQATSIADEFRRIKRPLIDNFVRSVTESLGHMNLIVVAGPLPGVGKTFCAVNLAASLSLEQDLTVVLIDADVAKQDISTAFGLSGKPGLVDLLQDDQLSIDEVLIRTDLNDMQVLPAGKRNAQLNELLASERMAEIMRELASRYPDRILVTDSPPLMATNEASVVARQAGQVVLVVESGVTLDTDIHESLAMLDPDKAINIILNKSQYGQSGLDYGSGYGHYGFNEGA